MKTSSKLGLTRGLPLSLQTAAQRCYSAVPTQPAKKKNGQYSFGKYSYYDAVVDIADLNIVRTDAYYIARQRRRLAGNDDVVVPPEARFGTVVSGSASSNSFTFDPRSKPGGPSYDQVFGGSSKTATQSSRRDLSYRNKNKVIAGVRVPARPIEPDNCCMSGCINCVWELFNEDLEEWRHKRAEAAKTLMSQKEKGPLGANGKIELWPHDWELPPKILDSQFISSDQKAMAEKQKADGGDPDEIKGMPVGLQVFAMFEKKKKEERKKKQEKKLAQASASNASLEHSINSSKQTSATL